MKVVIQRVKKANAIIDGKVNGEISKGLVVFLGISQEDVIDESFKEAVKKIEKLVDKIINLRVYEDENGKMNLSTLDVDGEILVISNFTLYGDMRKGNRPSYIEAAKPEIAQKVYNMFLNKIKETKIKHIAEGIFQADMEVNVQNDGPVTLIFEI